MSGAQESNRNQEPEKLLEMLKALPKHPGGAAGVALAIANGIHSCNHVVKVSLQSDLAELAAKDRARLVTALVNLSSRQDLS